MKLFSTKYGGIMKNCIILMTLLVFMGMASCGYKDADAQIEGDIEAALSARNQPFVEVDFSIKQDRIEDYNQVKAVYLGGDFNGWTKANPNYKMYFKKGEYTLKVDLMIGRYAYKFYIVYTEESGKEAKWMNDPNTKEFFKDPSFGKNSVMEVVTDRTVKVPRYFKIERPEDKDITRLVFLVGNFNSWELVNSFRMHKVEKTTKEKLASGVDHVVKGQPKWDKYKGYLFLTPGRYHYRIAVVDIRKTTEPYVKPDFYNPQGHAIVKNCYLPRNIIYTGATKDTKAVYLIGNFNDWKALSSFRFSKNQDGNFEFTLDKREEEDGTTCRYKIADVKVTKFFTDSTKNDRGEKVPTEEVLVVDPETKEEAKEKCSVLIIKED